MMLGQLNSQQESTLIVSHTHYAYFYQPTEKIKKIVE